MILSLIIPCIACAMQWIFWDKFQPFIWFLFYPSVFFSAQVGGRWGGAAATLLSVFLVDFFFIEPVFSLQINTVNTLYSVTVFILMGFLFSGLQENFKRGKHKLQESESALRALNVELEKRAEADINKLLERLNLATAAAKIGIWDWDIQKDQLVWDNRMYELYGTTQVEFPGAYETWLKGVHPDDREASNEISQQVLYGEKDYDTEFRVIWTDGSIHWLKANGQVFRDAKGTPLRMIGVNYEISERKRLEESLRESEQKYTLLFEKSTIPTAVLKLPEVVITDANEACEKLTGFTRQEMIGKTSVQLGLFRAEDRNELITRFERQGALADNEVRLLTKNGEARIIITNTTQVKFGGQPHAISTMQDITARKLAEQELLESRAQLDAALESMTDAVFISDTAGTFTRFNQAFATFHRFKNKAECAKTLAEYPDFLEVYLDTGELAPLEMWAVPRALRGETVANVEYSLRRKDTGECWVGSYSFAPIRNPAGEIVGSVVTGRDITERKRAEESLRQRTEELEQLLDILPEAIWISDDPECKVIHGNRFANELLGVTENDNISQSAEAPAVKLRQFSQGRELSSDELPMQVAARTGKSQHDFELRIDRTGDITHTLIGGAVPLFDPIGQPRGVVAAFHEITERKRAEDELRRSNAELEQFAYVASHDLQEPLRAVAGMVQLLSQRYKGKLDERADEYIGHAVEASLRMQNLINDLLDYSRVSRFGKPFVPTALESCVKTALANLDAVIQENQAQITYDPLPTVQADPGQLTQVFQNLIGNAIKFRGENSPCVHINAEIFEGSWRIAISDNGIGIEPQYFERIFLVFQRLHTRREYPGTGIGLSLCKKIIERHGGQIWVESLPGQGSTFYFSLAEKKE